MINESNSNPFEQEKGCGQLLRQAREAAGLSLEEAAGRLHMPMRVVSLLEQEQWRHLGAAVFVRGQLRSYARLLEVNIEPLLDRVMIAPVEPVKLVSHTHTPRTRRFLESISRKAMYLMITVIFAVPVWYATRSHLEGNAPSMVSLDTVPEVSTRASPAPATRQPAMPAMAKPAHPQPYIASMTPLAGGMQSERPGALSLRFNGDSWIQVLGPDGSPVEKALIHAGEERHYPPGRAARVVLGNASAVQVQQGGVIVDTKPFQRANVARFAVSSEGLVVSASE